MRLRNECSPPMAENNKKHSLQRRVYRTTRSAMRRWQSRPIRVPTRRPLKIFTNIQSASVAGIARVMSSFVEHAQTSGAGVEVVCVSVVPLTNDHTSSGWYKSTIEDKHTTSWLYEHTLPSFSHVLELARNVYDVEQAFSKVIEAFYLRLKEERPDVVLINGTYMVPWCLMLAAKRLRLPIVHHYHGSLTKETEHWKNEKFKRLLRAIEASFDRLDIRYIFPSVLIKHYVERHVFRHTIYKKRMLILPNPIPEGFFKVPLRNKKGVAFVGRWTRIKNTSFLDRFAYLNHTHERPLDIYVVTDAQGKNKASRVLHDRVKFVGPFTTSKDMADFYASMQVVVCPSHFETYGNVAQEAVAAGTPALVSRTMGVSEVFKSIGLADLVISFKNPRQVFDAIVSGSILSVKQSTRQALKKEAGAETVHKKLLEFIKT